MGTYVKIVLIFSSIQAYLRKYMISYSHSRENVHARFTLFWILTLSVMRGGSWSPPHINVPKNFRRQWLKLPIVLEN